jgi:hypothetical protein
MYVCGVELYSPIDNAFILFFCFLILSNFILMLYRLQMRTLNFKGKQAQ